ncbi:hypothetical protein CEXT_396571 [Caerostris extrusa]|uniref:Uncharacterized protein n=1 Tax=Caerostris extrusa TaxID=172846 RepID=A0AAV4YAL2_CAEEX|nr:hypothetical protein CEXT_396571 [Caerostris extrusa]
MFTRLGLGYNYGYNVYDRRFNDVALGYRGVVGINAPLVGLGGIRGLNVAFSRIPLFPGYPAAVPLVSSVPYSYGVIAPTAVIRDVRDSAYNVQAAGLGYNYGYNVYDRRFNDYALGYRGVLGFNRPLVRVDGFHGFRKLF